MADADLVAADLVAAEAAAEDRDAASVAGSPA